MIVLLYVMDSLRPDFLGCYGYDKSTSPNIDSLAQDSVRFTTAYSTTSWTKPAAASILTGYYPRSLGMTHHLGVLPEQVETLPQILSKQGFRTICLTANAYVSEEFGLERGFETLEKMYLKQSLFEKERHSYLPNRKDINTQSDLPKMFTAQSEDLNEELWRLHLGDAQPTFLLVWSVDTHNPYFVRGSKTHFNNPTDVCIEHSQLIKYQNAGQIALLKSLYCDMIRYNDYHFGELLSWLKGQDAYKNSLIILVGDHGEGFMEHGKNSHNNIVHEEQIRVPLIVKFPNNQWAGEVIHSPVQITDIVPTILDVLKMEKQEMDGVSLLSTIKMSDPNRLIFCETHYKADGIQSISIRRGPWKWLYMKQPAISKGKFGILRAQAQKLVNFLSRRGKLYNLEKDPHEINPIRFSSSRLKDEFLASLSDILARCESRRAGWETTSKSLDDLNPDLVKHLRGLGYL